MLSLLPKAPWCVCAPGCRALSPIARPPKAPTCPTAGVGRLLSMVTHPVLFSGLTCVLLGEHFLSVYLTQEHAGSCSRRVELPQIWNRKPPSYHPQPPTEPGENLRRVKAISMTPERD